MKGSHAAYFPPLFLRFRPVRGNVRPSHRPNESISPNGASDRSFYLQVPFPHIKILCGFYHPETEGGFVMLRAFLAVWAIALCMISVRPATAQVPARSVRLNVDTTFLRFNVGGWNPAGRDDWLVKRLEAGVGNPNAALGLGVTLVDALTVGVRLTVAYETEELFFDEEDSNRAAPANFDSKKYSFLRWGIMPYLDYAFLKKTIRPFIMLALGFEGSKHEDLVNVQTLWDFIFGLGGGLHIFASPSVSIDLTVLLGFSAGAGSSEPVEPPDDEESHKTRFTRIMFRGTGNLGVSGWF